MGTTNPRVVSELQSLCEALDLQFEPQDWGIANADGKRLSEFIDFWQSHPELSAVQKFEMGELILASANEAVIDNGELDGRLRDFLTKNRRFFEVHMDYWTQLQNSTEFPLAEWLRASLEFNRGSYPPG